MKTYCKTGNVIFFGILPQDTMEQVTHKLQNKGGMKPCNVSLYMVHSLYDCGKTVLVGRYISRNRNII